MARKSSTTSSPSVSGCKVFKHEDGTERLLADGDHVEVGQQLMEGSADPHEVLRVQGPREVQIHLVKEVQEVYRAQGVSIHDKHIEVIVRQMLRRVTDHRLGCDGVPARLADRACRVRGREPSGGRRGRRARGRPSGADGYHEGVAGHRFVAVGGVVPGDHASADRCGDQLPQRQAQGLKENVIIGKLIPAGTGINRYRNIQVQPTEEARAAAYTIPSYEDQYYSPDFGQATGAAVPLDDYGYSDYR